MALLKVINQVNSQKNNTPDTSSDMIILDSSKPEGSNDLGCSVLPEGTVLTGYVDNRGELQFVENAEQQKNTPCLSASFINKRKGIPNQSSKKKTKSSLSDDIEPMAIKALLQETNAGRQVSDFIEQHGFLHQPHQVTLMRIIYDRVTCDKESPLKYYPHTASKISIAKGIVTDYPQLADVGQCPWMSWLKIVRTKFETVQSTLPASKKKNKIANPSSGSSSKQPKPALKKTSVTSSDELEETTENTDTQKSLMRDLMPSKGNRAIISLALVSTFKERRRWIRNDKPTCTDILLEYKHLASYQGAMVSEEFDRMEPLHESFVTKFDKLSPYILKYAKVVKPILFQEVTEKFGNGAVSALVLLPKLLNVVLNKNSVSQAHLDHIKLYKSILEGIPSSALVQIVPEGTDVQAYESMEISRNPAELSPIFPYLVWVTSDFVSGKVYLKIDKKSLFVAEFSSESKNALVQALNISVKAHYVFNLEYHPYLKSVFEYVEYLFGIKTAPLNSVVKFASAIRQLSQSS